MLIDGYDIEFDMERNVIVVKEFGVTKSWSAMLNFCERFPTGHEPEWDAFAVKQAAMQRREIEAAMKKFRQTS